MALPIQAKSSDGSPLLSAIKPSRETDRPNRTFPMVFSFPLVSFVVVEKIDCVSSRWRVVPSRLVLSPVSQTQGTHPLVGRRAQGTTRARSLICQLHRLPGGNQ